ncbi:MAG: hypothetical protein MI674_00475 [Cytophagales bacterium]|nr:hypothetical protein [Cytophagales bacterium]
MRIEINMQQSIRLMLKSYLPIALIATLIVVGCKKESHEDPTPRWNARAAFKDAVNKGDTATVETLLNDPTKKAAIGNDAIQDGLRRAAEATPPDTAVVKAILEKLTPEEIDQALENENAFNNGLPKVANAILGNLNGGVPPAAKQEDVPQDQETETGQAVAGQQAVKSGAVPSGARPSAVSSSPAGVVSPAASPGGVLSTDASSSQDGDGSPAAASPGQAVPSADSKKEDGDVVQPANSSVSVEEPQATPENLTSEETAGGGPQDEATKIGPDGAVLSTDASSSQTVQPPASQKGVSPDEGVPPAVRQGAVPSGASLGARPSAASSSPDGAVQQAARPVSAEVSAPLKKDDLTNSQGQGGGPQDEVTKIGQALQPAENDEDSLARQQAIYKLNSGERLGNNTIFNWCSYLEEENPTFAYIPDLASPPIPSGERDRLENFLTKFKKKLEEAQNQGGSGVFFVPFVLKAGWWNFNNHIVVFAVDTKNKNLEYYNSQGGKIENEHRQVDGLGISASQLYEALKEVTKELRGDWSTQSNTRRHQQIGDSANCGVFVSNFMERRCEKPFDDICENGTNPNDYRKEMARKLQRSCLISITNKKDMGKLRKTLEEELKQEGVEINAENYARALEGYKIYFTLEPKPKDIKEEVGQIGIDLKRNMTIEVGGKNITEEIKKANAKIKEAKTTAEVDEATKERDTLVSNVVRIIEEKIPSDKQALIFPCLHQGLLLAITSKLSSLLIPELSSRVDPPDDLPTHRVGDPHLEIKRTLKVSEDLTTIEGEFPLCTEKTENNDSGEQPLLEVYFEVLLGEESTITCSFVSSFTNISKTRQKIPSSSNGSSNGRTWWWGR